MLCAKIYVVSGKTLLQFWHVIQCYSYTFYFAPFSPNGNIKVSIFYTAIIYLWFKILVQVLPLVKRFCLTFLHHVENNWLFDWAHCCSPKNNEQNNLVHVYKLDSQFSFVFFFDPFKNGFIASLPLVKIDLFFMT